MWELTVQYSILLERVFLSVNVLAAFHLVWRNAVTRQLMKESIEFGAHSSRGLQPVIIMAWNRQAEMSLALARSLHQHPQA